jgi:hypothetical protein
MAEASLFIWYHAGSEMEPELRQWLGEVRAQLGYRGMLYRRDEPGRTTYMEFYAGIDAEGAARIEALASSQAWARRLSSARRCEAFMPVIEDRP